MEADANNIFIEKSNDKDIYLKLSEIFFINKKEVFNLMKTFMYVTGSLFSALFFLFINLHQIDIPKGFINLNIRVLLCFIFSNIALIISFVFHIQITDLITDSKKILNRLFEFEKEKINNVLFQNFDSNYEFFGQIFLLIIDVFAIIFSLNNIYMLKEVSSNLNLFYIKLLLGLQIVAVIYFAYVILLLIFSFYNVSRLKNRMLSLWIRIFYKMTEYGTNFAVIIVNIFIVFAKTILVIFYLKSVNKKKLFELSRLIIDMQQSKKKILKFHVEYIANLSNKNIESLDKQILNFSQNISTKRLIPSLKKIKKMCLTLNDWALYNQNCQIDKKCKSLIQYEWVKNIKRIKNYIYKIKNCFLEKTF